MNNIVERILLLISKNNITAKELTQLLNISKTAISEWKSGKLKPSTEVLISISQIFEVSLDWLLTGKDSEQSNSTLQKSSTDEKLLLNAYRAADENSKLFILQKAIELSSKKEEAKKELKAKSMVNPVAIAAYGGNGVEMKSITKEQMEKTKQLIDEINFRTE